MGALVAGTDGVELFENRTTHASRTLMVADLTVLLEAVPHGTPEEYRRAILEENVLQKKSASARSKTREHLRALYFLDNENPVFSALSTLAAEDAESVPMLALLCGATRDVLLRSTAEFVSEAPMEAVVSSEDLRRVVEEEFPNRFSENTLVEAGRRALSSWAQSGHLAEGSKYARKKAAASVGSVVFALYLGHLSGVRGMPLYGTFWAGLLDASEGEMDSLAFAASQRGLMEYRRMGDVAEFGFSMLEARRRGAVSGG